MKPSIIPVIKEEIRECIPEIGMMIRNHLLDDIEIIIVAKGGVTGQRAGQEQEVILSEEQS